MGDGRQRRRWEYWWVAVRFSLLLCLGEKVSAQIRYSIPEEVKEGSVVGNVAKDLGLDVSTLVERRFRIVSGSKDALFQVNQNNGVLYVHKNIDREAICNGKVACAIDLKIVVENPLEVHYVGLEITDVNDHSPSFSEKNLHIEIAENKPAGARFELQPARDFDSGINSIRSYKLNPNEHFDLELRDSGEGDTIPFLILQKALDREQETKHSLLLTALDGGNPPGTGTLNITVTVLDANDNQPVCSQDVYSVTLQENADIGRFVVRVNATDADHGSNGMVEYTLGRNLKRRVHDMFLLDGITGAIEVKGPVDFEENEMYSLNVQASDKGQPPLTTDCRVIVKIQDVNDNRPQIEVTSLSNTVSEDSKPGTVISLISVTDHDSGINGKVISSITENVPFELKPSYKDNVYSIVTKGRLDREFVSHYEITITATDCGQPPLSTFKTLSVQISDVNDNRPEFSQNPLELYLVENNAPGASIFSVSASDKDLNENAAISYHIVRGEGTQNDMASFLNINSDNGHISALKSFDFEILKTFQFQVVATDSGTPLLSNNVTVNVFILDQNDNAPVILYPVSTNGSAEGVEEIPVM
uniref:protocadherin alpha-13-like n=1 Tax=Oncorhynchus gorbuscha TaxID=8017 RepID=UPI001EAF5166|nr:protocadherin alpha-13-like [Oncorhynchus gorbuscha]